MEKVFNSLDVYSIKNYLGEIKDKDKIIECVLSNKTHDKYPENGFNYPILKDHDEFFLNLYKKFFDDCKKNFNFIISNYNKQVCWAYISTKDLFAEVWHHHLRTSTINAVYYLDVPEKESSIDFLCEKTKNIFTYYSENDELLIFPNSLYHKPNRFYCDGHRISINLEIKCLESSEEIFSKLRRANDEQSK